MKELMLTAAVALALVTGVANAAMPPTSPEPTPSSEKITVLLFLTPLAPLIQPRKSPLEPAASLLLASTVSSRSPVSVPALIPRPLR
jgi:hypothetical protein